MRSIGSGRPSAGKGIFGHEGAFAVILTGDKLDEMCRAIWMAQWKSIVAGRLETTRQRLHRMSLSPTGHSKAIKRELLAVVRDQLLIVAQYERELAEDVEG